MYAHEVTSLSIDISVCAEAELAAVADEIESQLLASLRRDSAQASNTQFGIIARHKDGMLLGGLIASTSYGWLLIKLLWITKSARGRGLATRLMEIAETTALSRGCHGAWLDTSSVRANAFYRKLGYRPFGKLENRRGEQPEKHRRYFLCMRLHERG